MIGAINILQKWKAICFSHTRKVRKNEIETEFCECENCELKKYCVPHPRNISDEMIREVVRIINESEVENEKTN